MRRRPTSSACSARWRSLRTSRIALAAALTAGLATAALAEPQVYRAAGFGAVAAFMSDAEGLVMRNGGGSYFRVSLADGRLDVAPLPSFSPPLTRDRPDMLPDGIVTEGSGEIAAAWLTGPTERYRHAVLGDAIEASGLSVALDDGRTLDFQLPADSVFEDRLARLADMDGDGDQELVAVRSYLDAGAALAILDVVGGEVRIVAEAPAIGTPNRWLNPVGVADFDGDGGPEAAVVITPHIGGILTLYRMRDGRLQRVAAESGFSNHALDSPELGMSVVLDADSDGVPDIAVPDAARRSLRIVSFADGRFRELWRLNQPAEIVTAVVAADLDGRTGMELVYGLADGSLMVVKP